MYRAMRNATFAQIAADESPNDLNHQNANEAARLAKEVYLAAKDVDEANKSEALRGRWVLCFNNKGIVNESF